MSTSKGAQKTGSGGKKPPPGKPGTKPAPKSAATAAGRKTESATGNEYHHGDLRRALLAAGLTILEAEGSEALSLREVARRAGVSHNAPYRHFADREALLAALAAAGFERWAEAMTATGGDRLEIGVAYVKFAVDHPQVFDLMFGPLLSPANHPDLAAAMGRSFAVFAGQFGATAPPDLLGGATERSRPQLIAPWALVHGLAHLLLGKRMAKSLTGGLDVETLTRAVLIANAQATK